MSNNDVSSRIGLDEIVAAAGQGALRALAARDIVPDKGQGFYVEFHIRCGIPPYILQKPAQVDGGGGLEGLEG
jgi:hypothetical protein